MRKRTWILLGILMLILISSGVYAKQDFFKKQIARYYYEKAYASLENLDNKKSTTALLEALDWDPEITSKEYKNFQEYRSRLLEDPEKKEEYLKSKEKYFETN